MPKNKIGWCTETWNVVTGCTKIAQGCKNCYAERIAKRFWDNREFSDIREHVERLDLPFHWKKPRMVFVNSMSDLFHERVKFDFVHTVWDVMKACPKHIFQVLTKRPEIMKKHLELIYRLESLGYAQGFWDHVWPGVSVSTQDDADKNILILLETPAAVRWVSVEPMLEEIKLLPLLKRCPETVEEVKRYEVTDILPDAINWVVVGCESGPKRRECNIEWVKNIVVQCLVAKIPVYVKQLEINGKVTSDITKFPKELRIRQFPLISPDRKKFVEGEWKESGGISSESIIELQNAGIE